MKPVAVIPMNDPAGILFPHLEVITPLLKRVFGRVFVSVTAVTRQTVPDFAARLGADGFFQAVIHETDISVGEDFLSLYARAANACQPNQVLHLCFIDRVAYALQSHHQATFMADVKAVRAEHTPLIFERSEFAWGTHPRNYRELEQTLTRTGEFLFGRSLDFAWCHLVIQARRLREVIPSIQRRDISFVAEFTLNLRNEIQSRKADWLSWEDPFILSQDPEQLKLEREKSAGETHKRLAYVIPILQLLQEASNNGST